VCTSVGVEPLRLVRLLAAHYPRGGQPLKEATDPARTFPGGGGPHQGPAVLGRDGERHDHAGEGEGFGGPGHQEHRRQAAYQRALGGIASSGD